MAQNPNIEDAPLNRAVLGRYIITFVIFDILENQEPGKAGKIQSPDVL